MRIVIVGGLGFIGKNLISALVSDNHTVVCCDVAQNISISNAEYHCISDVSDYENILEPDDCVIYLQWYGVPVSDAIIRSLNNNVIDTIRFLDICQRKKVSRFIFSSSGGTVYGVPCYTPIDEAHRLSPISSYGIQKVAVEQYIRLLSKQSGLKSFILRISNPYGPGQRCFSGQGVIATYLASAITGKEFVIRGDGNDVRDYIYIDDLVSAFKAVIGYEGGYDTFNVGSGVGHSLNELVFVMNEVLNECGYTQPELTHIPCDINDVPVNVLNCELLAKEMKGISATDIKSGLVKTLKSWDSTKEAFLCDFDLKLSVK